MIMQELRKYPECNHVTSVGITRPLQRAPHDPNWAPAFTCNGPKIAPPIAFEIATKTPREGCGLPEARLLEPRQSDLRRTVVPPSGRSTIPVVPVCCGPSKAAGFSSCIVIGRGSTSQCKDPSASFPVGTSIWIIAPFLSILKVKACAQVRAAHPLPLFSSMLSRRHRCSCNWSSPLSCRSL